MPLKCDKPEILRDFITKNFNVVPTHPSADGDKFELPGNLVVNVFHTGTVNFQGSSHENQTVEDIKSLVEIINR